ncbi:hypothetical protein [Streptomyces cyaneofuscatus]|uniref:hypothetical protein n=1 Tax=Streptomyces cyaneofuscatus TaxID=66883 RepID=UPI00382653A8
MAISRCREVGAGFERGATSADNRPRAVFAAIEWGTQRSVIDNDPVAPVDLVAPGQLADLNGKDLLSDGTFALRERCNDWSTQDLVGQRLARG